VITGGANGVGFAYAKEFLRLGHRVVIADVANLDAPVAALKREFGEAAPVFAKRTDVSVWADVDALGDFAAESLGAVHHWINNAGVNGGRRALLDVPVSEVQKVVQVNLLGKIFCTKRALELLGKQEGVTSHLYNTVGSGVKGGGTPGYEERRSEASARKEKWESEGLGGGG
jgi:chlorophyll(ide) b reductase